MSDKLQNFLEPAANDNSLAGLLKRPEYSKRFEAVLGERAAQFASSLISIGNTMKDVEPRSILGSAMIAAALDLPIDKNLGFAWIVPYKGVATFQMGYKGYIQLGMRSAQYKRMNATGINQEVFKGWDSVGEPVLDWENYDPEKPIWGYFFGFELVNGFTKVAVWTKEKVHSHAQKYSQSYRAGKDIWKTQFDGMALKTVIANTLRKWGPMSVQLQRALQSDSAVIKDVDAEPSYIDAGPEEPEKPEFVHPAKAAQENAAKTAPKTETKAEVKPEPKKETKPAPTVNETHVPPVVTPQPAAAPVTEPPDPNSTGHAEPPTPIYDVPAQPPEETTLPPELQTPEPAPEPAPEPVLTETQAKLRDCISELGYSFADFLAWGKSTQMPWFKNSPPMQWSDVPDDKASFFCTNKKGIAAAIKTFKEKK